MTNKLTLPDSKALSATSADGRLYAPSAARNADPICNLVLAHAPEQGMALEIASGTGEHVCALARSLPGMTWQPSDPDPTRRISIDAHAAADGLDNIRPALALDACRPGWAAQLPEQDLILLVNLLHLISEPDAKQLIGEAATALRQGGVFCLYGPFLRDGETTSDGDAQFHASLQAQDATIGYKDDWDVIDWLRHAGLDLVQVIEMPANNLAFVSRKI